MEPIKGLKSNSLERLKTTEKYKGDLLEPKNLARTNSEEKRKSARLTQEVADQILGKTTN